MSNIYVFLFCFFISNLAFGQDLITDRPDQAESPNTVPSGSVQVESGFILERDEAEGGTVTTEVERIELAGTLFRIGLTGDIELRLGSSYLSEEIKSGAVSATNDGLNGVEVGAKFYLGPESGLWPEAGLIAGVVLPVGADEVTSDEVEFGLILASAHTLSPELSLSHNLGLARPDSDTWQFIFSAVLGLGISEKIAVFAEVYGDATRNERPNFLSDGGFTFLLQPNFQLDVSAGVGLADISPDWFISTGFSLRLPK